MPIRLYTPTGAMLKLQNTPRYMDFRIFNAPILGFKVWVLGLGSNASYFQTRVY